MASTEDQIREIRGSIAQVQSKKVRAAVELENAKARLADARKVLKSEFGVSTTEEAKAKLAELRAELDATVVEVEEALALAGA